MIEAGKLSIRINPDNPNHHIWDNNGTYAGDFTIHRPDFTKQRLRPSLRTRDIAEARRRRDELIRQYTLAGQWPIPAAFGGDRGQDSSDWAMATVS